VYALVPPQRANRRLGGGDGLRHGRGIRAPEAARHFGVSTAPVFGHIAIVALILNVAVSAVLTVVFRRIGLQDGYDETRPVDYTADR
jgi:hypothetical protein